MADVIFHTSFIKINIGIMKKYLSTTVFALSFCSAFAAGTWVGGNIDGNDYTGDINKTITGDYEYVIGGNYHNGKSIGNVEGNITLNVVEANVNGNFAGGSELFYNDDDKTAEEKAQLKGYVSGKVTVNFESGTIGVSLYIGNISGVSNVPNNYVGATELNFNGGEIKGDIVMAGASYSSVKNDVVLNMSAGTVGVDICGAYNYNNVGGNVVINISGGDVKGNIYAGGATGSVVEGNVDIVLSSEANIVGNVYAGNYSNATINGNTSVTLKDNAKVGGIVSGGDYASGTIGGLKNLTIYNYTGSDTVKVSSFDNLTVTGTENITLSGALDLANLTIDENSSVSLSAGSVVDSYTLVFSEDFSTGDVLRIDAFDVSIGGETIAFSSLATENVSMFNVMDKDGETFALNYEDGSFSVGAAIPEPAEWAAIFGALALGFVIYRRRR